MSDSFESILDESISALQAGIPVEEILAEAPEYAAQLRPLLFAATVLADPNPRLVPEERKLALRTVYLQQVTELSPEKPPTFSEKAQAVSRIIRRRSTPKAVFSDLATVIMTVVLTLFMALLLLSYVAQTAVPGDLLYSLKRSSESVQLGLTFGETQRASLTETFNQRRLAEIEQLIRQDRAAVVDFRGVLETKGENLWIIAGQTVFLPTEVILQGQPQEGDEVEVMGFLRTNEVLVADTISVIK